MNNRLEEVAFLLQRESHPVFGLRAFPGHFQYMPGEGFGVFPELKLVARLQDAAGQNRRCYNGQNCPGKNSEAHFSEISQIRPDDRADRGM